MERESIFDSKLTDVFVKVDVDLDDEPLPALAGAPKHSAMRLAVVAALLLGAAASVIAFAAPASEHVARHALQFAAVIDGVAERAAAAVADLDPVDATADAPDAAQAAVTPTRVFRGPYDGADDTAGPNDERAGFQSRTDYGF